MPDNDPYQLERFVSAQENVYETALAELRNGSKESHWMWFVFPQIEGLGRSPTSQYYSIKSREEARQYLRHPVLGPRLMESAEAVLSVNGKSARAIFGSPDDMKLQSSMTLFDAVAEGQGIFARVLERYFEGARDQRTLFMLGSQAQRPATS
jgi:uncharacterized protein (DUF1810 family)